MYLSFPLASKSKMKSPVQINGTYFSFKAFLISGNLAKKKSTKTFHFYGES
jgi:hypothetical protein